MTQPKADAARRREEGDQLLARLHAEFDRLNDAHFQGRLTCPRVELSARKTYGGYYQKREHRIVLSWQAYREYGWDETVNTFRHEVAHIVHQHHRAEFWALAARLGVTRKYASAPVQPRSRRVLVYECPGCRNRIQRRRRIADVSCARCDSKYNPAYRFRLVEESEDAGA